MKPSSILLLSILLFFLVFITGCSIAENSDTKISEIQELMLNAQDLQQLGMASNETACSAEEYATSEYSPLAQYGICYYAINNLNDTGVVVELKKFTNLNDLNGSYQYESSHYYGAQGLISENDFGDQSRFRVNNENDYGAEFNEPGIYYYHLYICKDTFLIHITSKGSGKEAKDYIAGMGRRILSKFE